MSKNLVVALTLALVLLFTGCLNVESKEYRFKLNKDGSGTGTITFVNIVSQDDDGRDISLKDFGELVTDYIEGTSLEEQNHNFNVTGKRLYENDGKLMGEVTFTFTSLDSFGFFRQSGCNCCPILLYGEAFQEAYATTDGQYLGENSATPFILWQPGTKEFYVKTTVLDDLSNTRSLLAYWQDWKSKDQKNKE